MRTASLARMLALASAACVAAAEGINCNGSELCKTKGTSMAADIIAGYIDGIDRNRWYNNGEHIACHNNVCAFLQYTGGAPGQNIPALAHFIANHGCGACGSVPYFYPSDNNVYDGELTFNYVTDPCGDKLC